MIRLFFSVILFIIVMQTGIHHSLAKGNELLFPTFKKEDYSFPLPGTPLLNLEKVDQLAKELSEKIYIAPKNATLNDYGQMVPEEVGVKLNEKEFKSQFVDYFYQNSWSKMKIPTLSVYPKVDSELLSHIKNKQIGYYVTYFNSHNKTRSHNIRLSAEAINNHVVFPGEKFSFNEVVGRRTEAKGYLKAPVIVRGELSEGIGGGICQVSSTLFNAVDRAGMDIIERYSHSKSVPYVPPGRDATVSWYGPDFSFKNSTNQPILIRSKAVGGTIFVMIYSSELINNQPRNVQSMPIDLPAEIRLND